MSLLELVRRCKILLELEFAIAALQELSVSAQVLLTAACVGLGVEYLLRQDDVFLSDLVSTELNDLACGH